MTAGPLDLFAVAPLGFVVLGALVSLALHFALQRRFAAPDDAPRMDRRVILTDARIGTTLALACAAFLVLAIYTSSFAFTMGVQAPLDEVRPLLSLDPLSSYAIALTCIAALLCVALSITYLPAVHVRRGEHYALMMLSTAGIVLLVSAVDLVVLFLGFELMTVPLYALAGLDASRARSGEAALKLLVTGLFSSALFLFGIALLYGATGQTSIPGLRSALESGDVFALAGLALVLCGFGFRLAIFPFHAWAPDVLSGAPTAVACFFSSAVKTASFSAFLRFLMLLWPAGLEAETGEAAGRTQDLLVVLAAATLVAGGAMALVQTNVKRMIAHAGVAHSGMLLLGLACGTERAYGAVLFYLLVYCFMALGVFAVLIAMSQGGRDCEQLDSLTGLGTRHPTLAAAMALFLLALAGVPGTAGFMARFELFVSAIDAGQIVLVVLASVASLLLLVCHLRIVVAMYMRAPTSYASRAPVSPSSSELTVLALCALAVIYLGFLAHADPFGTGFRALDAARFAVAG